MNGPCAVDRYTHGVTMMPGVAARHLSVEVTARDASLTSEYVADLKAAVANAISAFNVETVYASRRHR